MARARILDHFQNHHFHLLDVSPSLSVPPFAFNLIAGFSAISTPEISLDIEEIAEGNAYFKHHVVSGGSVSNITLQRGASFYDSEFWVWISSTLKGEVPTLLPPVLGGKRRNLLLIQYTGYQVGRPAGGLGTAVDVFASLLSGYPGSKKIPGRAWMLMQCLPVRYKPGSDFDATSAEVSISELELAVHSVEELAVGA